MVVDALIGIVVLSYDCAVFVYGFHFPGCPISEAGDEPLPNVALFLRRTN